MGFIEASVMRCNRNLFIIAVSLMGLFILFSIGSLYYGILLVIPVYFLYRWDKVREDYRRHAVYKGLAWFGDPGDIETQINNEAQHIQQIAKSLSLSPRWLIHTRFLSNDIYRNVDTVWVYPGRTNHYVYFVPTGTTHQVHIKFISESAHDTFSTNEIIVSVNSGADGINLIKILQQFAPWVFIGYYSLYQNLWRKDKGQEMLNLKRQRIQYIIDKIRKQSTSSGV